MRKILSLTAAIAAAFAMGSTQAANILVDDFNLPAVLDNFSAVGIAGSPITHCYFKGLAGACGGSAGQQAVGTSFAAAVSAASLATERDVTVRVTVDNTGNADMTAKIGGSSGRLNLQASTGDIGTASVAWTLPVFSLPAGASSYFFSVLASTLGSTFNSTIGFAFVGTGGNAGNNFTVPAQNVGQIPFNAAGTPLTYSISAPDAVKISGGGILTMNIGGSEGWSILLDQFAFSVPEPASLALVGLALIGAGFVSRSRKT